ncbi:MAG: FG-GAP-like repeat-containing protein [candidate division WOR-3 bacterium]|jgi:tetratricopeptide (TPR) repeat protein|nr:FG-GAP-like repeat-containing protein [candidate division WOR-3 bacterium]MCR4423550.1 FG-GAP-like repeat-containing protein [candidate division WOR-3 bacterium]MDH7518889.1 FG-GAP-like repeat-containing protein [bacterium]
MVLLLALLSIQFTLTDLIQQQDYAAAVQYCHQRLNRKSDDLPIMHNLARVFARWHRFDSSLYWWEKALKINPNDDSAIVGRWQALYELNKNDPSRIDSIRLLIKTEALPYFLDTSSYRSQVLGYQGMILADTVLGNKAAGVLTALFPDSALGYELIGAMFYDSLYPIWNNDTAKVLVISRFLTRYPKTEWRATFYFFLLSSLYALKDTFGLVDITQQMLRDDSLDPFRYRYAAALFNRLRFRPRIAEIYARRAIELEPRARKPRNKPEEEWQLEYPPLFGLARTALAEALIIQHRHLEALPYLKEAINRFRWDVQNEMTPAPFYCLLGEVYEYQGKNDSAQLAYLKALAYGDSRNYWTARADTALQRLGISGPEQLVRARQLLNYSGPIFTDVTDSVGLTGRNETRVAWGDYNNDGFEDLLLNGCRLFRNDSGIRFTDVTDAAGISAIKGRGGIWFDFNNDYWLDLYISGADTVDYLLKNCFGKFTNVTESLGSPSDPYPTEGVGAADFDQDGWIDLYCANYENWETHTYYPDRLYKNEQGFFKDVTEPAGIIPPYGENLAGRGVNWADFDDDGYPDCYVSNYRLGPNFLWHNKGDGTFENLAPKLGVAGDEVKGWYGHSIGSAWADYDNDGDLDLFVANLAHPRYIEFSNRSILYENRGLKQHPRFVDRRAQLGIRYEETHSDPAWADVDNDGDLDLFITSIYEGRRSFLYLNQLIPNPAPQIDFGNFRFQEATYLAGTRTYNGWGCAFADYDNDGDLDLVVGSSSGIRLFRNDTRNSNHWLKIKLVGTKHNAAGIGARIIVTQGKKQYLREVEGGKGTTSQNSLVQHFGLGNSNQPVTVKVRFGINSPVILKDVSPDHMIIVTEP